MTIYQNAVATPFDFEAALKRLKVNTFKKELASSLTFIGILISVSFIIPETPKQWFFAFALNFAVRYIFAIVEAKKFFRKRKAAEAEDGKRIRATSASSKPATPSGAPQTSVRLCCGLKPVGTERDGEQIIYCTRCQTRTHGAKSTPETLLQWNAM